MGRFTKAKKEEGEAEYPKLNVKHLQEITELYIKFNKKRNLILKYWEAVKLDSDGNISAICDFTDWYNKSDHNKSKYETFQPLKGIFYTGHGFHTFSPFSWCNEWLTTWDNWIREEANRGDVQAQSLMSKTPLSTGK